MVKRSYREFLALYKKLKKQSKKIFPAFPPKKPFSRNDPETIKQRIFQFNLLLRFILKKQEFDEEIKEFLDSSKTYRGDSHTFIVISVVIKNSVSPDMGDSEGPSSWNVSSNRPSVEPLPDPYSSVKNSSIKDDVKYLPFKVEMEVEKGNSVPVVIRK